MKRYLKYLILLLALTVLSGCSFRAQEGPELSDTVTPLTQEEIDVANEALAATVMDAETGEIRTSEVSCFFTCYYDKPEEISLSSFLKYFPNSSILENSDEAEFAKLRELPGFPFNNGRILPPWRLFLFRSTNIQKKLYLKSCSNTQISQRTIL